MRKRTFQCDDCDFLLVDHWHQGELLWNHYLDDHSGLDLKSTCDDCNRQFQSLARLRQHIYTIHRKPLIYQHIVVSCDLCSYNVGYARKFVLHRHHLTNHVSEQRTLSKRLYQCDLCPFAKVTASKCVLWDHFTWVHGAEQDSNGACNECGTAFSTLNSLRSHVRKAHGTPPPPTTARQMRCELCGFDSGNKSVLWEHFLARHGGVTRTLQCDACPRQYGSVENLSIHVRRDHLGLTPSKRSRAVRCDACGHTTNEKGNLLKHLTAGACPKVRTAVQRLPWGCDVCGRRFCKGTVLAKHFLREHLQLTTAEMQCDVCEQMVAKSETLYVHFIRHTQAAARAIKAEEANNAIKAEDDLKHDRDQ